MKSTSHINEFNKLFKVYEPLKHVFEVSALKDKNKDILLQKLGHGDQSDYALFMGDLCYWFNEIESFTTILPNMKLSNDMIISWLESVNVLNLDEKYTRLKKSEFNEEFLR